MTVMNITGKPIGFTTSSVTLWSSAGVSRLRDRKLNRITDHMFPRIKRHSWNQLVVSGADKILSRLRILLFLK